MWKFPDVCSPPWRDTRPADQREKLARLRDEENRQEFAIRKAERRMAHEEHELERTMQRFQDAEERAKQRIEDLWRRERWGHEPDRPAAWTHHGR